VSTRAERRPSRVAGFRTRLLVAMMLIVSTVTGFALYFAERNLAANVEENLQREFQAKLATLQFGQQIRHAALDERTRGLNRRSRFHAALEDRPAPDLLYPNAEIELRDIMQRVEDPVAERARSALHAEFYRFLDAHGRLIPPDNARAIGLLRPEEEAQLALPKQTERQQFGYIWRNASGGGAIFEIITSPIVSTETGEVISSLVLGFKPLELDPGKGDSGIKSGVWVNGRLDIPGLPETAAGGLAQQLGAVIRRTEPEAVHPRVDVAGLPHQLFYKWLNPGSLYPPAYEVGLFPLTDFMARQRQLRWQVLGIGALLLLGGLLASHVLAGRLSQPVEELVVDSEEERAQRVRAEAALETTSEELQRSARFSADASHQLRTPVTVLRAGLEELLTRENLTPAECHEISALIHQTFRLSSLIEDLLLLSRMDAGRLKLDFAPVNLSQLIEGALDDLGALPDELHLRVETEFPADLHISGEKRYTTIILHNLFENARKYNRTGGCIQIVARTEGDNVFLTVGNNGKPIGAPAQAHIFERFHRGSIGENVPGYGLGLNLARELARLHGGELRLVRSDDVWTEFEVRFRRASAPVPRELPA
jgi:signal transduction histidine kinase